MKRREKKNRLISLRTVRYSNSQVYGFQVTIESSNGWIWPLSIAWNRNELIEISSRRRKNKQPTNRMKFNRPLQNRMGSNVEHWTYKWLTLIIRILIYYHQLTTVDEPSPSIHLIRKDRFIAEWNMRMVNWLFVCSFRWFDLYSNEMEIVCFP